MKNKKVFGVGLVSALVLILGIGFFLNSKNNTKRDVEVDLSVATAVVETYVEEKYEINPLITETIFDNQAKKITVCIYSPGNVISEFTDEEYKIAIEYISEINLDAKEVVSKLLDRNDINLSIKIFDRQNPGGGYLIEIVNGKIEFSFR